MPLTFKLPNKEHDVHPSKTFSVAEKNKVLEKLNKIPLSFITNSGQINSKVKYYAKGSNFGFYFTEKEVVLSFTKRMSKESIKKKSEQEEKPIGVALKLQFVGANRKVKIEGHVERTGKINCFKGNNPEKWYTDLSMYEKIIYKELWNGIDLVFYGEKKQLKYEFVVHPKGNLKDIKLRYKGAEGISLDEEGNLLIKNELGILMDEHPISYQEIEGKKVAIDSRFIVKHYLIRKSTYSFDIEKGYNPDLPIIIDPGLIYSTFLGGASGESGERIAIDNTGNAYVTGITSSPDFPTTAGAFQPGFGGGFIDGFITKLNASGTGLVYSTYLGSEGNDACTDIAVDNTGSVYVTGVTQTGFPITAGAFQTVFGGGISDAFITKLNAAGSGLIYSTYLGGNDGDQGFGIAIDSSGNAYVTGKTNSGDFPTTAGAFQTTLAGDFDAFVTKLNAAGAGLVYSTYLGGGSEDEGNDIAVDSAGSVYVTGETESGDFPTTAGAFQTVMAGSSDAFVTNLNTTGTGLVYSTYLGGNGDNRGEGIAIDNMGNAFVTGETDSSDFPTTTGAFQTTLNGTVNAFVTKINTTGTGLTYSTYLGGSDKDAGNGIAVDGFGSAYVTGGANSLDFPITSNAFQAMLNGINDAFITKLNAEGTELIYSTYLGGNNTNSGHGVAVDNMGNAYVTGQTVSVDFPTTPGAFQTSIGGAGDAFITKISTNTVFPEINITNQNMTAIVYESDI